MKKFVSAVLIILVLASLLPLSVATAADKSIPVSGKNYSFVCKGADTLVFGGREFASLGEGSTFNVIVTTDDSSSAHNTFYLNGKKLASIQNGVNTLVLNMSDLKDKENTLGVFLGTDTLPYNEKMVYGAVNLDDITVVSVRFESINFDKPYSVNMLMPIEGKAGYTPRNIEYKDDIRIGDGWFEDTKLGGNTPTVPIAAEYVFDKPDLSGTFILDTTQFPDGVYEAEFKKGGEVIRTVKYRIDNTPPVISFSASDGAVLTKRDRLDLTVTDASDFRQSVYVDGRSKNKLTLRTLVEGRHTVYVTASDEFGNTSEKALVFTLSKTPFGTSANESGNSVISVRGDAVLYSAKIADSVRMYENRYGTFDDTKLRSSDELLVSFDDKNKTVAYGNAYPYQSFVVDVSKAKGEVIVSYEGSTGNGVPLELKAWNPKESRYDTLTVTESGVPVSFAVDTGVYSNGGKLRVNVVPKAVYNGSDTVLWNSDTQYYSRYDDLHAYYNKVNEYAVSEYGKGNIAYCVHTGDLVDRTNAGEEIANSEYGFASEAQSILDKNGVPNGVVSGNHDINHTEADYSYYWKYFSADRYRDYEWYGGDLNNNMHHYDLVSIGRYDFVFIYLGCYKEAEPDTIAWVNAVCRAYPNRNAVLCMHEYLLPSGVYSGARAPIIWEKMVVPNENVKMILCGHNEGVCDQIHEVEGTGRKVLEILADYQFAENGQGPQHVENGCTCDGEGYIRLMSFTDGGQLVSTTYSPVAEDYGIDPYEYFPSFMDSFIYDMDLIVSDRSIKTERFDVVYGREEICSVDNNKAKVSGCEAVVASTKINDDEVFSPVVVLKEYNNNYKTDEVPEYAEPVSEKYAPQGDRYVYEGLKRGEKNSPPDPALAETAIDLMPAKVESLYQTSGSKIYETFANENGNGFSIHHSYSGANWVTLANIINKSVDTTKYNRIYFGVTAPKDAKWNLEINFGGKSLSFSRTEALAKKFGYINYLPSDIQGTWQGYIDLSEFISGNATLNSVYFVTATPEMTVSFDYLFIGRSIGQAVRFVTDDVRVSAYEAAPGGTVALPAAPYRFGYTFLGWYDSPEGGSRVEQPVPVKEEVTTVYARFKENAAAQEHKAEFSGDEPEFRGGGISLDAVIIIICIIVAAAAIAIVYFKLKKTKSKENLK